MTSTATTSIRDTIDFFQQRGELITIKEEVDPVYQITGIQAAVENGPALLFENIKGYPGVRNLGNLFSRRDRLCSLFGADDYRQFRRRCLEAIRKPLPASLVEQAPCQEVVVDRNINAPALLPFARHTKRDGGRLFGGGIILISGKYFRGGNHLSFNRMNFRWPDQASLQTWYPSHLGAACFEDHRGEKVPITVNICPPPAVLVVAATGFLYGIVPMGADELGFAGALQGFPVEIVKARTVEAYSIAQAEWVIEGYIDTTERAWETDEAEKADRIAFTPFFPEWTGYLGRAFRNAKFHATAITHRRERPIFHIPLAHSFDNDIMGTPFREASFFEMADRLAPGFVVDVNTWPGVAAWGAHIIFQVKKRRRADEGFQRNILNAALAAWQGLRMAVAVDEDVDIYSPEDVLWAIVTRVNPRTDILQGGSSKGQDLMPMERTGAGGERVAEFRFEGGLALDATVPYDAREGFERGRYPVEEVDLKRFFSQEQLAAIRSQQSDYARLWARRGG